MYGIFFEEINQGGEGGLYAELVRTRGMEGGTSERLPVGWKAVGSVTPSTDTPNPSRPISLKITRRTPDEKVAAVNEGFWGIAVKARENYRLTLWLKSDVPLRAALQDEKGNAIGSTVVTPKGTGWQRFEVGVRATKTVTKGSLSLSPATPGTANIAFASLMPPDRWKGRDNGLRNDLATHINGMKPGFVRFPGGCFIEGNTLAQAFDWKKTVGPVETRHGLGSFWGYPISNGLGFHEFLQFSEDLGARGLFVANCGMSHNQVATDAEMPRYVQDALDALEYAKGPVTSKWGAMRAKNGHPKPFDLHYIEIGNENGGASYERGYKMLAEAIKANYPDVELVADVWGGTPKSYPLELIDEHYYNNPAFFWRNAARYDRYDRSGPKVYVGEYAVTRGCGNGNLAAALGEAAFMTGMERNADVVRMASYAPLFANVNNRQWNPNAIVFDNHRSYGTPSYWVQWLFGNHVPTRVLETRVKAPIREPEPLSGGVGLITWRTGAEFKDVKLESDGKVVFDGSNLGQSGLTFRGGDWSAEGGLIRQTKEEDDRRMTFKGISFPVGKKVTLSMKARKLSGAEGFIVVLATSPSRTVQWNLGGWGNTVHAFQINDERVGRGMPAKIESNRWYDIRLEAEGGTIRGYLDGKFVEEVQNEASPDFAAVAGIDEKTNEIVIKAVNGDGKTREVQLNISGAKLGSTAKGVVLHGNDLDDENSLDNPDKIHPETFKLSGVSSVMKVKLAPYSVTVLRIPRRK